MILLCSGQRDAKNFDALILFALQMDARGHKVAIDETFVPDDINRHQKYEVARFLCVAEELPFEQVIVIGAEVISNEVQILLRTIVTDDQIDVVAIARFETNQARIASQNKIAYVLGREPRIVDLAAFQQRPLHDTAIAPIGAMPVHKTSPEDTTEPQLFVFLPADHLEDPAALPALGAMSQISGFDLNIIIAGEGKNRIRRSKFAGLSVFGYAELSPLTMCQIADIAVFFGANVPGERMAMFALNMMRSGKPVIDSTQSASFTGTGAPALRGPEDIESLTGFLQNVVLINRAEIGRQMAQTAWLKELDITHIERALGLNSPEPDSPVNLLPNTLVFPTNGSGLGHAQRCAVIGEAMHTKPAFAAFPSCVEMLRGRGFKTMPLVQRGAPLPEEYANDLITYLRLRRVLQRGDRLVFDGGYVFDSVYRCITELALDGIWIRRGLWQKEQITPRALSRETIFSKVIVPGEAFEELNASYSYGARLHHIGPVVNDTQLGQDEIAALRLKLSARMDNEFDQLVVTMLGGGVASDRAAQMQMMCNIMERRPNCLHLIVAWPNSIVPAGLYGWKNTRVVQTRHAQALMQAADLIVSAVGYNSFHEVLYNGLPTIFIPQAADFLDDQERRARAASERGLASTVLAHELLLLEREVTAYLDEGKADEMRASLRDCILPDRGNAAAAALIEDREL